jgi:hypothetical protein
VSDNSSPTTLSPDATEVDPHSQGSLLSPCLLCLAASMSLNGFYHHLQCDPYLKQINKPEQDARHPQITAEILYFCHLFSALIFSRVLFHRCILNTAVFTVCVLVMIAACRLFFL